MAVCHADGISTAKLKRWHSKIVSAGNSAPAEAASGGRGFVVRASAPRGAPEPKGVGWRAHENAGCNETIMVAHGSAVEVTPRLG
jgi:hypothetical protein